MRLEIIPTYVVYCAHYIRPSKDMTHSHYRNFNSHSRLFMRKNISNVKKILYVLTLFSKSSLSQYVYLFMDTLKTTFSRLSTNKMHNEETIFKY